MVAVTQAAPVERTITRTRPGRSLAERFVAGDTLDDAVDVVRRLNDDGFLVSLDHLGEGVHDVATVERATEEYLEGLDRISGENLAANISVKPTQLGLAIDEDLALESIGRLVDRALEIGTTVTLDMEDSRYTDATVRLYERAQTEAGGLGIALQAYLHRTPGDLERLLPLGGHIRLCKGAYVEPPGVALQSRSEIDEAYARQLERLMAVEEVRPAIATHDTRLIDLTRRVAAGRLAPFEFQMLYGVRPELQKQLLEQGFPLRVYLPFGSQWYPYLTRRLAERPANAWFFMRAVLSR